MAKQDEYARITLRLPSDLHARLLAAADVKSLNAEIVERLERSFENPASEQLTTEMMSVAIQALDRAGYLKNLQDENERRVIEDVRHLILIMLAELEGRETESDPAFGTEIGNELARFIDERTELGMRLVIDGLIKTGRLTAQDAVPDEAPLRKLASAS